MRRSLPICLLLVAVVALAAPPSAPAAGDDHAELRAPARGASWLAIAPRAFVAELEPLRAHREATGLPARVVAVEDVIDAFATAPDAPPEDAVLAFVRHASAAWPAPRPRYLLLVGRPAGPKGKTVPTFHRAAIESARELGERVIARNRRAATDHPYAVDDEAAPFTIARAVGRLPVANAAELRELVAKIVAVDRAPVPGLWRRRISLVAGQAGFGAGADATIEAFFARAVAGRIPERYDVDFTYAKPGSPWFYPPEAISDRVVEVLDGGPLVFAYVGHGQRFAFDSVAAGKRKQFAILDREALAQLRRRAGTRLGRSLAIVSACDTGWFDDPDPARRGIAEEMALGRAGPLAVLASSRVSHPYANAVLSIAILETLFAAERELEPGGAADGERILRVGDVIATAKAELGDDRGGGPLRRTVDAGASAFVEGGRKRLRALLAEETAIFNLFGDPASVVPIPPSLSMTVTAGGEAPVDRIAAGARLRIRGEVPGAGSGVVHLSLERPREQATRLRAAPLPKGADLDPDAPGAAALRAKILARYLEANDWVVARREVRVRDGRFDGSLRVPAELRGKLVVKAAFVASTDADRTAGGGATRAGAVLVTVTAPGVDAPDPEPEPAPPSAKKPRTFYSRAGDR